MSRLRITLRLAGFAGAAVILVSPAAVGASPSAMSATGGSPSWKIQNPSSSVSPSHAELIDVSCSAPNACTAVGASAYESQVLIDRRSGGHWTRQSAPKASGILRAVDCRTSTACVAVGYQSGKASLVPLIESWDGSRWTLQPSPSPKGARESEMRDVACASSTLCYAVGFWAKPGSSIDEIGPQHALLQRWNGRAWTMEQVPQVPGARQVSLHGVACTSALSCMTVGWYEDTQHRSHPLIERWTGAGWTVQPTSLPLAEVQGLLLDVDCVASGQCVAVGSQIGITLMWNGSRWSSVPAPGDSLQPDLVGVSCSSARACTAIGHYYTNTRAVSFAARWNGSHWYQQPTPNPSEHSAELQGVDCPSPTACVAVGYFETRNNLFPLFERYS